MEKLKHLMLVPCMLLLLVGCESTVTNENKSVENLESDNPSTALQQVTDPSLNKSLAEVRSATAMYQNLNKADADGYVQFSPNVPNMGFHYLHDSNINEDATSSLDNNLNRREPEILVYADDASKSSQRRLMAVEYAIPKNSPTPPENAVNLFPGLDEEDWHVHPSSHELPLPNTWTIHGECHYEGGVGIFLAENPAGDFVLFAPPTGSFSSWSGTVEPAECPTELSGNPLPPLLLAHGKWWTLHAWIWYPNPEGIFHATNPRVGS